MGTGAEDFDIQDSRHVTDPNRPKRPLTYRMINVMCYLMRGLNYTKYFNGRVKEEVMPHFVRRLEANSFASRKYFLNHNGIPLKEIAEALHDKFGKIVADPNIPSNLLMRKLYEDKRGSAIPNSPEKYPVAEGEPSYHLWQRFAKLRADDRGTGSFAVFEHLCMPFLYQSNAIAPTVIDLFLNGKADPKIPVIKKFHGLGKFELVDLYRNTKLELAKSLLEDMYKEALTTAPNTPRDDFFNPTIEKHMVEQVQQLISVGQMTALLILHSPLRYNDLKSLIQTFPGLTQSITILSSKPNDQCCDGSGCDPEDDKFCSKTIGGGCSAASDDCPGTIVR